MHEPAMRDQAIVVIGGTSGMGLAATRACLAAGARVVAVGIDLAPARDLTAEFAGRVLLLDGNATEPATAANAVDRAEREFGPLAGLMHVAGGSGRKWGDGPLHELSDDGWRQTIELNLDSVFYSNRAALRAMLAHGGGGAILNMASVLAISPAPRYFATHAYATAKSAIMGLTRSIAAHYASRNIRCNAIAPGLIETPMSARAMNDPAIQHFLHLRQPLDGGRAGRPGDIEAAVVYLLSSASRFVTGQVLAVDGGWSVSDGVGPT